MKIIKKKKIVDENAEVPFPALLIGSFFLTGLFPSASGTVGSAAAAVLLLVSPLADLRILIPATVFLFVAGMLVSGIIMKRYGDDPSVIVVDEAVGMWTTVIIFLLSAGTGLTLFYLLICFLVFRFFDIVKLQPAKSFDKLKSPLGVMMDDVIAGIYAGIVAAIFSYSGINLF